MRTSDFDYLLPEKFIAQSPVSPKDSSRLMIFDTQKNKIYHKHFYDLPNFLNSNDVLVVNRSKVIPARILFKHENFEKEIFILKKISKNKYECLVRPGKFFKENKKIFIDKFHNGVVLKINIDGSRIIKFNKSIESLGQVPVPLYIKNKHVEFSKYQTIYCKEKGSVAAPTAGLHFTKKLLAKLKKMDVKMIKVLLHVGRGTFLPVTVDKIKNHKMHAEFFSVSKKIANQLNFFKKNNKRIIAVGTTSVRVLESNFKNKFSSQKGQTNIFIYPGHKWKTIDGLITNFHLPKSTLIMLVSAFLEHKGIKSPIKKILSLYELAKKNKYRFYSFGDAMFIY